MERWKEAMKELKKVDYVRAFFRFLPFLIISIVITMTADDWSAVKKIWYLVLWITFAVGMIFFIARFSKDNIPIFEKTPDAMILHWVILTTICMMILLIAGTAHFIVLR